jgi:AraC-like DNA-binding protein
LDCDTAYAAMSVTGAAICSLSCALRCLMPYVGPLERFIERIDVTVPKPGETRRTIDLLPDGTTSLVLRVLGDAAADVGVRGPCTRAYYKTTASIPLAVRVVFRPGGAYPFFGVSIGELADRIVSLDALWGSHAERRLLEQVIDAMNQGDRAVVAIVEQALTDRMRTKPFEPAAALAARAAVPLLARGDTAIDDVVRELGISGRHLRRAFHATVGLGPKAYARIARFQRALALASTRAGHWNDVAVRAGYFDQAHLIADFRDLALVSPGAFDGPRVRHAC